MSALIGRKIIDVRPLSPEEMAREGWKDEPPIVLVLDKGELLYPSRDPEGNGPGALFGVGSNGETCVYLPTSVR